MAHQDKALNEKGEEDNALDTTPVAEEQDSEVAAEPEGVVEPTPEAVEPKSDLVEPTEEVGEAKLEGEEAGTGEVPKKGYTQRVRELVKEREEAKAEAQSLKDRLAELTGSVEPQEGFLPPYQPQVEPGTEISPEQYQTDVLKTADGLVTLKLKQFEAINRINDEAVEALKVYPALDPESESFNRELSDSVTEAVEAHVKANPYSASVKKFVDKLMKPYEKAVTKEVGQVTEKLAKQVSETALRPTSVKQGEKPDSEKTIAELENELGVVY
ncbi:MAG: hypothetical protein FJ006_11345 [Chloroflexi bacterium]|nr:hypothetical protein [Chloroflexota bacterium]